MIVDFSISNFSSVKEGITLSFLPDENDNLQDYYLIKPQQDLSLLKLGLIYGANATGKTTILKALDFLRDLVVHPLSEKTERLDFTPFLFDAKTPDQNTTFSLTFIHKAYKYTYTLIFNQDCIVSEKLVKYFTRQPSVIFTRKTDQHARLSKIKFGSKAKVNKNQREVLEANTLWNNTVLGGYIKTNVDFVELEETLVWFKQVLMPMVAPQTGLLGFVSSRLEERDLDKREILTLLQKADLKINDIQIEEKEEPLSDEAVSFLNHLQKSGQLGEHRKEDLEKKRHTIKEIWFEHQVAHKEEFKSYLLPYTEESSGTQRYYQLAGVLSLILHRHKILPIDELEASLHPDLFKHFLLIFLANASQAQVIATTHHRELLREKDMLRSDAIWFTEKKDNGGTDLFSLADFDSSVLRKDTGSFYNAYKTGKLGAQPLLDDYYLNLEENG